MRWCIFHYLLLAAIILEGSSERSKRDLMYLKNLFRNVFEGKYRETKPSTQTVTNAPEYRIPALQYDNIANVPETHHNLFRSDGPTYKMKDHLVSRVLGDTTKQIIHDALPATRFGITLDSHEDSLREVPSSYDMAKPKIRTNLPTHTQYFYKQLKNNKPVITYVTKNVSEPTVDENAKIRSALPGCIQKRIAELIVLGDHPDLIEDIQTSYPIKFENKVQHPLIQEATKSKVLIVTKYPEKSAKEESIEEQPLSSIRDSWPTDIVGLIPPPYIPRKVISGGDEKDLTDIPEYLAVNVLTKTQPFISRYSYKQLNNNSPAPFTEVKVGNEVLAEFATNITNFNGSTSQIVKKFVYVPPLFGDGIREAVIEKINQNSGPFKNKDMAMGKSNEVVVDKDFKLKPIIVADDEIYQYYPSSNNVPTVSFNNNNVSRKVFTNERGDIPEP